MQSAARIAVDPHRPWDGSGDSPLLGIQDGRAQALLYNGILGDKRPGGGNVLYLDGHVNFIKYPADEFPMTETSARIFGRYDRPFDGF